MDGQFVIRTERLVLRPPVLTDFDDFEAVYGDAGVVRHLGGRPFTREESWARLMRHVGHWKLFGYGFWVMRDRLDGQFVGDLGFANFRRDIEPGYEDSPEAGWVLQPSKQRQGFAIEAMRAAHDWFDERIRAHRTVCIIAPENTASTRLAEKCGYKEYARTQYKKTTVVLHERLVQDTILPRTSQADG
jgi:RimJ/RimL family protein N-acetyltransferase